MKTCAFTIVSNNYLAFAKTLMQSLRRHSEGVDRYVILVDEKTAHSETLPARLVTIDELGLPEPDKFKFRYTILELNTAVKPWAFAHLLSKRYDTVLYFDPDIRLFDSVDHILEEMDGASIALMPHATAPFDDGKKPSELDVLRAGTYNLGFLGLKAASETDRLLDWWKSKLEKLCVADVGRGLFVDQKWMEYVPSFFENVKIIKHPGCNVAYWNLSHRSISRKNDAYLVNGTHPLVFFHFSGLKPLARESFSIHQDRFRHASLNKACRSIVDAYCDSVIANGHEDLSRLECAYAKFNDGTPIPDFIRSIYRESAWLQLAVGSAPFDRPHKAFSAPCRDAHAAMGNLNYFCAGLYLNREDLRRAFPDITGRDHMPFLLWMAHDRETQKILIGGWAGILPPLGPERPAARMRGLRERTCAALRKTYESMPKGLQTATKQCVDMLPRGLNRHLYNIAIPRPPVSAPTGLMDANPKAWPFDYLRGVYWQSPHEKTLGFAWATDEVTLPIPPGTAAYGELSMVASFIPAGDIDETTLVITGGGSRSTRTLRAGEASRVSVPLDGAEGGDVTIRSDYSFVPDTTAGDARRLSYRLHRIELDGKPLYDFASKRVSYLTDFAPTSAVSLVGYARTETGMGQSLRSLAAALSVGDTHFSIYDISALSQGVSRDTTFEDHTTDDVANPVRIFHVNADQTTVVHDAHRELYDRDAYRIGYWVWELPEFPDRWANAFAYYDEIWTPSNFSANSITVKTNIPVFTVPHAIDFPAPRGFDRAHFGLPEDAYLYLIMFDANSYMERKNPLGSVQAYLNAFPKPEDGVGLVVKMNNPSRSSDEYKRLMRLCDRKDIRVLDTTLTRAEVYALQSLTDCLISLHRSEGFGLCIAEMMYLGNPVIATGWSGNTDFMTSFNSLPVDYALTSLKGNVGPYDAGSTWAEPDIDHAASLIKKTFEDSSFTREIAQRAASDIRKKLSPGAVNAIVKARLRTIKA